jgi:hypothetical protein
VIPEPPSPPQIRLTRPQLIRLVVVGFFVVLGLGRVVPDFVRFVYPLQIFRYVTDYDGKVIAAAPRPTPTAAPHRAKPHRAAPQHVAKAKRAAHVQAQPTPEPIDYALVGDRVRVDRIKPFDRKPGLAGRGFTYDNPDRHLPVDRDGKPRVLHLVAGPEPIRDRTLDLLRIFLVIIAVGLGAILFLVKPSIATASFFIFCLGAIEAPSTYADLVLPTWVNPIPDSLQSALHGIVRSAWQLPVRPLLEWIGDTLHGMVRPALLLFALCLIDGDADAPRERVFAWCAAALGLVLGTVNAYSFWLLTYAGRPAESVAVFYKDADYAVMTLTGIAFLIAFVRARANDRHRIGWIVAAFVFAGISRLISDEFYPAFIPLWFNSILVSMTIVPIVAIWIAVVRHQFFNVDFVVGRAVVYAALSAAGLGTIMICEELGSYLFYNNVDVAYGVVIAVSMAFGAFTGKLGDILKHLVDRFIFRDRHQQREALEFIAGYILDALNAEDVYRALLQDAAGALKLSFGGILVRQPDGSYELGPRSADWPPELNVHLSATDDLTAAIARSRGALTFSGKETRLIQASFPNDPLTFAAPLFFDRVVSGIVVYGHNVSGLDLDPDERELLVRVVAHASIALNAIELNRYRNPSAAPEPLPAG